MRLAMPKADPNRHAPREVDDYLAAQSPEFRTTLERLRSIINSELPECTERVSYKIPIFRLNKDVVAISAAKEHCSLHTMSKAIPSAMKDELQAAGVGVSGTTLHFDPATDLPVQVVKKVLELRRAELS